MTHEHLTMTSRLSLKKNTLKLEMPSSSTAAALAAATAGSAFLFFTISRLVERKSRKDFTRSHSTDGETKTTYLLAGDIGGTYSRFALHLQGQKEPLLVHIYTNEDVLKDSKSYHHAMLQPFFEKCLAEVTPWMGFGVDDIKSKIRIIACLAVAGPVTADNTVFMTNVANGCRVDGAEIERSQDGLLALVVRCKLVNDFVGQGYGVLDLNLDQEVIELIPGSKENINALGVKACVGAGTGLGECFLTINSLNPQLGYECFPSEGGHTDFIPRGPLETDLLEFLKQKFQAQYRVSTERVVSGLGLANVYEFLVEKFPSKIDRVIHEEFLGAGDQQGRVVGQHSGIEGSLTQQAMHIMMAAYGAEVGNACLKFIPTGGLFLTGGLTPKNLSLIQGMDSPFMKAYLDKGRLSSLISTVPLFAVKNEDIGLRGARVCAEREFNAMISSSL